MAEKSAEYLSLREAIEIASPLRSLVFPYSSTHIHELMQIGIGSGLSKEVRLEKALPKLEFIRQLSGGILLETSDDYSQVVPTRRDPVEFYQTCTEVEIAAARIGSFLEVIPRDSVIQIQESLGVGSKRLNDLTEEEAISKINHGLRCLSESFRKSPEKLNAWKAEAKMQGRDHMMRAHQLGVRASDELMEMILKAQRRGEGSAEERQALENVRAEYAQRREDFETKFQLNLQSMEQAIDAWGTVEVPVYTFEMLLSLVDGFLEGRHLPISFKKTILLDFFGYNSKVKNRRSDFYDALHVEHAKVCDFFVTDDTRLREKLGGSNRVIPGTSCQVLSSKAFESYLRNLEPRED